MRVFVVLGLLGFASLAQAQEPPKLTLAVSVDEAHLIVQTLGAIGCQTVTQLVVCDQAKALLGTIRDQVKAQSK